ncbi:MAG: hypothetical protein MJ165_02475 [Alphaproteobacteria bacterium]|nr:hypothetical protein [Alphaproteobacteria bacterium]
MAVACDAGHYLSDTICTECAKGTYNSTVNAGFCNSCPAGFTTVSMGATSIKDCVHYVDKFNYESSVFEWPESITPGDVDTSNLSFQ